MDIFLGSEENGFNRYKVESRETGAVANAGGVSLKFTYVTEEKAHF